MTKAPPPPPRSESLHGRAAESRVQAAPPTQRVLTAARAQPLPKETRPFLEVMRAGATNLGLNSVSIAKEQWEAFRKSDRFFKMRAGIIATWATISCLTLLLVCPGSELAATNGLGARLVVAGDPSEPVYMVLNDSDERWNNVTVIANERYRASVSSVEAHGNLTVTAKQLVGPTGPLRTDAPVVDLELRTGRGKAHLMKAGQFH